MQWTCQLFVKTGTPPDGELMVLLQGGGVTLFQGEFSTPTGWLDKPLVHVYLRYFLTDSVAKFDGKIHNYYVECQNERNESIAYRRVTDGRTDGQSDRQHLVTAEQPVTAW